MSWLTVMGDWFIETPWRALWPAAAFAVLWVAVRKRSRAPLVAAAVWVLYFVYEYLNYKRITCSGECNIRIDLFVIYPALVIVSAAAVARQLYVSARRLTSRGLTSPRSP